MLGIERRSGFDSIMMGKIFLVGFSDVQDISMTRLDREGKQKNMGPIVTTDMQTPEGFRGTGENRSVLFSIPTTQKPNSSGVLES